MTSPREQFAAAKRANPAFFFPERAVWSDGVERRFKVSDPNRATDLAPLGLSKDPLPASLRLVKFHPDEPWPAAPASVMSSKGLLLLGMLTDESNLFGTRVGVCRLVDERAYPAVAGTADGQSIRLRIQALATAALNGGDGLKVDANNSHRGFLPPGIALQVGDVLTLSGGDQYQVVPPVQRDALGDTLGLSWMGSEVSRTPTEGNDPTPDPPADPEQPAPGQAPPGGYDPWWDSK